MYMNVEFLKTCTFILKELVSQLGHELGHPK